MNLKDIEIFIRTAEVKNLSQAAREMNLTPAVTSAAIKRLEKLLASRLLIRSTRSLRLTPEGEVFKSYCSASIKTLQEGIHYLSLQQGQISGEIRVSAPADAGKQWVAELCNQFQQLHPDIHITLLLTDIVSDFYHDNVDLAVRYGELQDSNLVAFRLLANRRVVCASPGYFEQHPLPHHPCDLSQHNCLTMFVNSISHHTWIFYKEDKKYAIPIQGDRTSNDSGLVRQWAIDGKGIAYKSYKDIQVDLLAGNLIQVLSDYQGENLPISLVYPQREFLRPVVRALIEYFKNQLK